MDEGLSYPFLLHTLIANNRNLNELHLSNCSIYDEHFLHIYPRIPNLDQFIWEDFDYYLFQHVHEKNDNPDGTIFGDMMEENVMHSINSYTSTTATTTTTAIRRKNDDVNTISNAKMESSNDDKMENKVHMIPNVSTRKNPLLSLLFTLNNLKICDISYCKTLTDNGIKCISALCPHMKNFYLRCLDQKSITDESIHAISLGMRQIKVLDIGGCTGFTNAAILHLIDNSYKSLEELVANGMNKNVNFMDIRKMEKLRKINMANSFVKRDTIDDILQYCKFIAEINVSYCKFIKDKYVLSIQSELARRRRHVNIIHFKSKKKIVEKKESKAVLQARIKELYLRNKEIDPTKKKKKKKKGGKKKGGGKKKKKK